MAAGVLDGVLGGWECCERGGAASCPQQRAGLRGQAVPRQELLSQPWG